MAPQEITKSTNLFRLHRRKKAGQDGCSDCWLGCDVYRVGTDNADQLFNRPYLSTVTE